MVNEIPRYGLKAYALFFTKHGSVESFGQSELNWIVKESMRKKIFSLLLRSGWIKKKSRDSYVCVDPDKALKGLLEFKVHEIIKEAEKPYMFVGSSAIEIWSDFSYVQRGIEKSPYFIEIIRKDLRYWKAFFSSHGVPFYVGYGETIGEYVILEIAENLDPTEKDGLKVIGLSETMKMAGSNDIYLYAYGYMRDRYGSAST